MKKILPRFTLTMALAVLLGTSAWTARAQEIAIHPDEAELVIGDSLQFTAQYTDEGGSVVDTTFTWSVRPMMLGAIDTTGLLTADAAGEGYVVVHLGNLADSASVTISESDSSDWGEEGAFLTVQPGDTLVPVGTSIQYSAIYQDTSGVSVDTAATWSLHGMPIGTISEEGLATVQQPGVAVVTAQVGELNGSSIIFAADTLEDSSGVNHVDISRVMPNGHVMPPRHVDEGQILRLGGLPHPMNVLNGGWIYFPMGSLHEDISIHILLPEFAHVRGDSVDMGAGTLAGIRFQVYVGDSLADPYYFDTPLFVSLPFKRGLLRHLGIDPADLSFFFALDSTDFDTTGISGVVVDSVSNRIYSRVAHFSTLVVREAQGTSSVGENGRADALPQGFELKRAYPNPFNATTLITYSVPFRTDARLAVYNVLGQRIRTLVTGVQAPGLRTVSWDSRDSNGSNVTSGVYFIRLEAAGYTQTRKVMLIR